MIINTSKPKDVLKAEKYFNKLIDLDCRFELKKVVETRTSRQNRALHLFFTFISSELNNLGLEFIYNGLKINGMSSRYTDLIVKEFIWRPIQIAMFDIEMCRKAWIFSRKMIKELKSIGLLGQIKPV